MAGFGLTTHGVWVGLFANRPPQSGNLLPKIASGLPTANLQFAYRLLPENP